jgi:lipoprotein-anchoring transpeptidase ErfK/SrfK
MPDYHAILWRALRQGDFRNARWREGVFAQTRQMLRDELRGTRPPMSAVDMNLESDALETAIDIIEGELAQDAAARSQEAAARAQEAAARARAIPPKAQQAVPPRADTGRRGPPAARSNDIYATRDDVPTAEGFGNLPTLIAVAAVVVLAGVAAGGYALMSSRNAAPPQQPNKIEARKIETPKVEAPKVEARKIETPKVEPTKVPPTAPPPAPATAKVEPAPQGASPTLQRPKTDSREATLADGDLPPGIDGSASEPDVPFYFRRQPVFYRTTHPVGSIIIDKQQHFLYFIRPNHVALRYGIGVGKSCAGVVGLHKLTAKKEWPEWQPPADAEGRKLSPAGAMKGGAGNPLGARSLTLDDGGLSIHGTNAPKSIGGHVDLGCIRLVNEDVADLYNRVDVGTRVVFSD